MKLVTGKRGFPSGKNTIINTFTGLSKSIAYVAQTAFLVNGTLRENILFGEDYDPERYQSVIRGCSLEKDIQNLQGGDLTEIGERGVNLSGGQKQRISLARACYSRAAVVLLDDPLSAVDAPTARFLLHKCILGLLNGRTVILVSHATSLVLPFADHVVVMEYGEIKAQGLPDKVDLNGICLEKDEFVDDEVDHSIFCDHVGQLGTILIEDEERTTGSVKNSVYYNYFRASGGCFYFIMYISTFFIQFGMTFAKDFWLKIWTQHNMETGMLPITIEFLKAVSVFYSSLVPNDDHDSVYYIGIYALIGVVIIIWSNIQKGIYFYGTLKASRKLHSDLIKSILYSPVRFFETTPIGRILNRFSKDIETADNSVLYSITAFIFQFFLGFKIISVILIVSPIILLFVPIVTILYKRIANMYLSTSRELNRIESSSRSPIYSHFSESLNGVATIRAYGAEQRFEDFNAIKIDDNHKPFHFVWVANRWLCIRAELLSIFVVLFAGLAIVFSDIGPGMSALILTYSFEFTDALVWAARMHAEMSMNMNSGINY
jgi:ABC-type multidrug transport system fused ATPase/permease subunit